MLYEEHCGATPGIIEPHLTPEPLGTSGELSPGPDDLRPEIPAERAELERRGYLPKPADRGEEIDDFGVEPATRPSFPDGAETDGPTDLGILMDPPISQESPLPTLDGPLFR